MCENTHFLRKLPYAAVPLNALLYTCMAFGAGLSCVESQLGSGEELLTVRRSRRVKHMRKHFSKQSTVKQGEGTHCGCFDVLCCKGHVAIASARCAQESLD